VGVWYTSGSWREEFTDSSFRIHLRERERDAEQSTPKRVRFVWLQIERKRLGKNQIPGFSKLGS